MGIFSTAESEYVGSQRLARVATVGPDGRPHVVPVTFRPTACPSRSSATTWSGRRSGAT